MAMDQHDWSVVMGKIELTVAWHELESLYTERVIVLVPVRGDAMWRAHSVSHRDRSTRWHDMTKAAKGALNMVTKGNAKFVNVRTIQEARTACVQLLTAFGHEVFA